MANLVTTSLRARQRYETLHPRWLTRHRSDVADPAVSPTTGVDSAAGWSPSLDYLPVPLMLAQPDARSCPRPMPLGVDASPVVPMSCAPACLKMSLARAISSEFSV